MELRAFDRVASRLLEVKPFTYISRNRYRWRKLPGMATFRMNQDSVRFLQLTQSIGFADFGILSAFRIVRIAHGLEWTGGRMSQNTPKDWRELCRKAQEELDPDKLMDLIVEINRALDEQARRRKENPAEINELDIETESRPSDLIFPKRSLSRPNLIVSFPAFSLPQWLKSA